MNPSVVKRIFIVVLLGAILGATGVSAADAVSAKSAAEERPTLPPILLMAPRDSSPLDAQIRASQLRLTRTALVGAELERLGWLMVAKARASSDPGFYTLAGVAADALEQDYHLKNEAWLLRGHVLQTRHRFTEAEDFGRRLVTSRGSAADYALLGDALYDQGRIAEAADAYQQMVNLKPGLDAYARAANIRWIKGDLSGAIELQTLAVRAGGGADPGAAGWNLVRLAQLVWQDGDAKAATALSARALELVPDFQPALLLRGRLLLADGKAADSVKVLARAVEILPLPEPRWAYAEALRAAGGEAAAIEVERLLVRDGLAEDPRTVASFLATRDRDSELALRVAAAELKNRADVMTRGVNALTLAQAGRMDEAMIHARGALREGTIDARLLLHVGRAAALAKQPDAAELLHLAAHLAHLLLPSEQRLLEESLALLAVGSGPTRNIHEITHQKSS